MMLLVVTITLIINEEDYYANYIKNYANFHSIIITNITILLIIQKIMQIITLIIITNTLNANYKGIMLIIIEIIMLLS